MTTYTCNGRTHSCAGWNWANIADAVWEAEESLKLLETIEETNDYHKT